MKKELRVCKNYEFSSIIQKRQFVKSPAFVCYYQKRKEEHARVGISVGKKLGNAVHRNKIKRQVRSMIDSLYNFKEEYDTIIIVRPPYLKRTYQENIEELKMDKTRIEKKIG
ncbi:MAG: ribonuclease P protein component [Bacillota bacterium]|nr:ribonuclease P protein component [Bacillota bacterium]